MPADIPYIVVLAVSFAGGAIASVVGFGIGSVLTPLLTLSMGTSLAVAAISIPHFAGTVLRLWAIRTKADLRILRHFGILSAAGGLVGALLHASAPNTGLGFLFAVLLIFAGITGATGYASRMRFGRKTAWFAGALSGLLGGLVGNQGGIRSAALLTFGLDRHAFVATATAIGLAVDAARMPVYIATSGEQMLSIAKTIAVSTVGVVAGTAFGMRVLQKIPEHSFHRVVGAALLGLGLFMLLRTFNP